MAGTSGDGGSAGPEGLDRRRPRSARTRRRALRGAALAVTILAGVGLTALGQTSASADVTLGVPAPYVSTANSGDPHTKPCNLNGQAGICLFTSQDLDEKATGNGNTYPMTQTLGYFSTDGINWQGPTTLMDEGRYEASFGVQHGAKHLWAPSAQVGNDGNWHLYVPDISDVTRQATSSFIGMSVSTNGPMGPYTPVGKINPLDVNGNPMDAGYMSDPDVVDTASGRFGTQPKLFWADGDASNCGAISEGDLDGNDMRTVANVTRLQFTGIPSSWGGFCRDRFGRSHPYMEGAHVYNPTQDGWPAGVPGTVGSNSFLMVVPIKPQNTPAECATNVQGQPGTANQVIAWLTAASPSGPWNYGGIIMCGSAKEYTDQGTVIPVTTSPRTNGFAPMLFVYHDGAPSSVPGHHRALHGECLFYGNGRFATAHRMGGSQFTDSGAESECLLGFPGDWSIALRSTTTGKFLSQNKNNVLTANRYGVGPLETLNFYSPDVGGPISATAGAFGAISFGSGTWGPAAGLATVNNTTSPITSVSGGGTTTGFNFVFNHAVLTMTSVRTGKGVRALTDGTLRADASTPEQFTIYHQ